MYRGLVKLSDSINPRYLESDCVEVQDHEKCDPLKSVFTCLKEFLNEFNNPCCDAVLYLLIIYLIAITIRYVDCEIGCRFFDNFFLLPS